MVVFPVFAEGRPFAETGRRLSSPPCSFRMYHVCARVRQLPGDTDRAVAVHRRTPGKARSRQRIRSRGAAGLSRSNFFSGESPEKSAGREVLRVVLKALTSVGRAVPRVARETVTVVGCEVLLVALKASTSVGREALHAALEAVTMVGREVLRVAPFCGFTFSYLFMAPLFWPV